MDRKILYIVVPSILVLAAILGVFPLSNLNTDFLKISITDYITTICALIELLFIAYISYFLTEKKNDERILKEKLKNELDFILNSVNSLTEEFFDDKFESRKFTILKKKIDRSIFILDHYKEKFHYIEEISNIKKEFETINVTISNHIEDVSEIRSVLKDIEIQIDRIDNDYSNIFLKLFK